MRQYFNCRPTPELETRYATALAEVGICQKLMLEGTNALNMATGLSMGTGAARTFCQRGYKCAVKFPLTIDEDTHFTLLDYESNYLFDAFWYSHAATRQTIADQTALIEGLHGRAMMNKAQHIKDKMEEKKALPKYKADYDQLNEYYTNRTDMAKETKKTNELLSEAEKVIAAKKE